VSRILFCLPSVVETSLHSIDPFYEGFIKALYEQGHDVHVLKTNNFFEKNYQEQNLQFIINREKYQSFIQKLNPEYIFAFNNSLDRIIVESTNCPIVCWSSESLYYLLSQSLIKQYKERYYFFHFDPNTKKQFEEEFDLESNKSFLVICPSAIQAKSVLKSNNITFVGAIHRMKPSMQDFSKYSSRQKILLHSNIEKCKKDPYKFLKNDNCLYIKIFGQKIYKRDILDFVSRESRVRVLSLISDLGLSFYGVGAESEIKKINDSLYFAYKSQIIDSLKKTELLYNSSKICINIPNCQSVNALSWRVPDILASNSVLVSSRGLKNIYGSEFKLPSFDSPAEAYEICKRLLHDQELRKDLTAYSNDLIEKGYRFSHLINNIDDILGKNFHKKKDLNTYKKVCFVMHENYCKKIMLLKEKMILNAIDILPKGFKEILGNLAQRYGVRITNKIKLRYKHNTK